MVMPNGLLRAIPSMRGRLRSGSLLGDVATLGSFVLLAQLAALFLMPVVTRLYSPSQFGVFAAFSGIAMVMGVFACGRYELSIVLPRSDKHGRLLVHLCLLLLTATSLTVLLIGVALASWVSAPGIYGQLLSIGPLFGIAMFATGVKQVGSYWLIRTKRFRDNGVLQASSTILAILLQIIAAVLFGADWRWLVIAAVVTQVFVMFGYLMVLAMSGAFRVRKSYRAYIGARILARYHYRFPVFSAPANLMNIVGYQAQALLMPIFFPSSVIGELAITMRSIRRPVQLIGQSLGKVLTQRLSRNYATGISNIPLIVTTVRWSVVASIGIVIPVAIWGPDLFALVFGEKWRQSGVYAAIMLPMMVANLCMTSTSKMFIYRKNHIGLIWQVAFALGMILSITIGGMAHNALLAVILFSASGSLLYLIHLSLTLHFAGGGFMSLFIIDYHHRDGA